MVKDTWGKWFSQTMPLIRERKGRCASPSVMIGIKKNDKLVFKRLSFCNLIEFMSGFFFECFINGLF